MSNRQFILTASNLDTYFSSSDISRLDEVSSLYCRALEVMRTKGESASQELISIYGDIGSCMQNMVHQEENLNVYSFTTPRSLHGEASYLISKLRDHRTPQEEFIYYTQRSYEILFNFAYFNKQAHNKNYLLVSTPVTEPTVNLAVHKIPNIDELIKNTVMCVMLRGALLPSMIVSKAIEEYSSMRYITPFSLFRIQRNDEKTEENMEYTLDVSSSFFNLEELHNKDLIFADPMNATGGSLVTVLSYLRVMNIKPRSITLFTVVSALKGALRILRAMDNVQLYTLWLDPMLNEKAYIMPGLGDAGDRINGIDSDDKPRNIIQLIADYGRSICNLYRSQVRAIEKTVLP